MEVRPGYKQTELGVIPEHWHAARLGDKTTKVGSGITPTGGARVYKQEGRPFLRSQNVGWGNLLLDDVAFIDDETHATFQDTEIEADDVFLNITGASIGRSAVADARVQRGNVNQHVCIIRTDKRELHPRFLNYFLLSTAGQRQIDSFQAGGNRQGLNFGQVRSFRLPLPPALEQRGIAEALSDADALIESLEQLLAKKRHLKQGAMQDLLTGKKRLPGFGAEWKVKRLGALADIRSGGTPSTTQPQFWDGDVLWCTPTDITGLNGFKYLSDTNRTISQAGLKASSAELLPTNSLVMTSRATIGECAINRVPVSTNQGFKNFIPFENVDVEFLYYLVLTQKQGFISLCGRSTFLEIGKAQLATFEVRVPTTSGEQAAIAVILSDMDAEIAALEAKLAKARQLKQGMMQELLTGRIRLPVESRRHLTT